MTHRSHHHSRNERNGGRILQRVRKILHRAPNQYAEFMVEGYCEGILDSDTMDVANAQTDAEIIEDFELFVRSDPFPAATITQQQPDAAPRGAGAVTLHQGGVS